MPNIINLAIIDDHKIVREGIKKVLCPSLNITNIYDYSSIIEFINSYKESSIDIIILDLCFNGKIQLTDIKFLTQKFPLSKVIIFTMFDEYTHGLEALKSQAKGFLNKQKDTEEINNAIQRVMNNELYFSANTINQLTEMLSQSKQHSFDSLSAREKEVLSALGQGMNQNKISEILFLSPKTVHTYKQRIMSKLKLNSNADIIKYCIEKQLVSN